MNNIETIDKQEKAVENAVRKYIRDYFKAMYDDSFVNGRVFPYEMYVDSENEDLYKKDDWNTGALGYMFFNRWKGGALYDPHPKISTLIRLTKYAYTLDVDNYIAINKLYIKQLKSCKAYQSSIMKE